MGKTSPPHARMLPATLERYAQPALRAVARRRGNLPPQLRGVALGSLRAARCATLPGSRSLACSLHVSFSYQQCESDALWTFGVQVGLTG